MKTPIRIIATVLVLSLCAPQVHAVFLESVFSKPAINSGVFESLGPVAIRVEDLLEDVQKAGLTRESLASYVELRLRQGGVPVRDMSEATKESPYLNLNVNITYLSEIDHYIFRTELSLRQSVMLLRNGKIVQATTWDNAIYGIGRSDRITGNITRTIDQLLDTFVSQYFRANPKNTKTAE